MALEFTTLTKEARDIIILLLRDYFKNNSSILPQLRYNEDPLLSKIFISDRSPEEVRYFPCIVTQVGAILEQRMGFGQFGAYAVVQGQDDAAPFKRYTGKCTIPFSLIVATRSTWQRDVIMDRLWMFIMVHKLAELQQNGLLLYPNSVSISGESTYMWDDTTPIERNTFNFKTSGEWYEDVEMPEAVLEKVDIQDKAIVRSTITG